MSVYDERPWLARYPRGLPHEIEPEHETMLDAFAATVRRLPEYCHAGRSWYRSSDYLPRP